MKTVEIADILPIPIPIVDRQDSHADKSEKYEIEISQYLILYNTSQIAAYVIPTYVIPKDTTTYVMALYDGVYLWMSFL